MMNEEGRMRKGKKGWPAKHAKGRERGIFEQEGTERGGKRSTSNDQHPTFRDGEKSTEWG
jgi:hypothetical protein